MRSRFGTIEYKQFNSVDTEKKGAENQMSMLIDL